MKSVRQRRRILYDIPFGQNIKRNDTNEVTYKTETDSDWENRPMVANGEETLKEFGINTYILLYFRWITNKALLYIAQGMSCARLHGRGVWGRMDTCICRAESLHCPPETTTTL